MTFSLCLSLFPSPCLAISLSPSLTFFQYLCLHLAQSNAKGKFLTRSHAMRESTSPPRTPTPRSGNLAPSAGISDQQQQSSTTVRSENSNRNPSTGSSTVHSQQGAQQQQQSPQQQSSTNLFATNGNISVTQLDLEFPKLTPPKSKSPRNNNNLINNNNSNSSSANNNNTTTINSSIAITSTVASNRTTDMDKSTPSAANSSACNGPVSPPSSAGATAPSPLIPPVIKCIVDDPAHLIGMFVINAMVSIESVFSLYNS